MDLISSKYIDTILDDFSVSFANSNIKCDVYEENNKYVIEVELPGFKKENLNIEINDEILTISAFNEVDELVLGENNEDVSVNLENRNYWHQERNFGMFERSFCLKNLNTENVEAKYNDGILSIEIIKNNQDEKINRVEIK